MESSGAPLSSVVGSVLWSPQSPFRSGALPRFASISRDVEEQFRLEMHEGGSPSDSRVPIGQGSIALDGRRCRTAPRQCAMGDATPASGGHPHATWMIENGSRSVKALEARNEHLQVLPA